MIFDLIEQKTLKYLKLFINLYASRKKLPIDHLKDKIVIVSMNETELNISVINHLKTVI